MFMLCYKNGGLARERVRDAINAKLSDGTKDTDVSNPWNNFDRILLDTPPTGQKADSDPMKMGLFFPRPEIVPNLREGEWHFNYTPGKTDVDQQLRETDTGWNHPFDGARAIVESQFLSLRLRSRELVHSPSDNKDIPPQPRRIYLVGGGSRNAAIAKVAGEVLGGIEGVYKLDVGENACALGAAYKAVWALERAPQQTFEDLVGQRWREDEFVERIADGYPPGVFEKYGHAVRGFEMMEKQILQAETKK